MGTLDVQKPVAALVRLEHSTVIPNTLEVSISSRSVSVGDQYQLEISISWRSVSVGGGISWWSVSFGGDSSWRSVTFGDRYQLEISIIGGSNQLEVGINWCTEKKEKQIFLVYKNIQSGAVAKSYMRKGFLINEEAQIFHHIRGGL